MKIQKCSLIFGAGGHPPPPSHSQTMKIQKFRQKKEEYEWIETMVLSIRLYSFQVKQSECLNCLYPQIVGIQKSRDRFEKESQMKKKIRFAPRFPPKLHLNDSSVSERTQKSRSLRHARLKIKCKQRPSNHHKKQPSNNLVKLG